MCKKSERGKELPVVAAEDRIIEETSQKIAWRIGNRSGGNASYLDAWRGGLGMSTTKT